MNKPESKKEKFSKTVLEHFSSLKRFALSLCKNDFDADDMVSETIMKAYQNFERVKDSGKTKQWLFRILNNQFISEWRNKKRFIEINFPNEGNHDNDLSFSLFEEVTNSNFVEEGNPEKKFISKLAQSAIQQAINNLPGEFKTSLILCDMEDFSYSEIAIITGVPVGTVRSRIARARNILQKQLWLQAQELGIKRTKNHQVKKEYSCTCGKEEVIKTVSIQE